MNKALNDNHIALFFIQGAIVLALFVGILALMIGFSECGNIDSFSELIATIINDDIPEERTALHNVGVVPLKRVTAKTFDFKNMEIWLTPSQMLLYKNSQSYYLVAKAVASFLFIIFGIGKVYAKIGEIMSAGIRWGFKFSLDVILLFWVGLIVVVFFFALGFFVGGMICTMTFPIGLIYHLVKGIKQTVSRSRC